ncbi:MAG: phosphopantetheine-binding protein [Pseudomonadota bacterium]
MAHDAVAQSIAAHISADLLGGEVVGPGDDLLLSDLLDSLSVVRLVAHLEASYAITIPPEDVVLDTMQTADAIAAYLATAHDVTEPLPS